MFLPLFAVSLGTHLGWVSLHENWQWLAGLPVLISTGIATLIEIAAYYIPVIDHFIDGLAVPIASIAGTILFASQFTEMGAFTQWALALIVGGGTASVVGAGFAGARAVSTTTTAGLGNPFISTLETLGAVLLAIISFALPFLSFIIVLLLLVCCMVFGKKIWNKYHKLKLEKPNVGT